MRNEVVRLTGEAAPAPAAAIKLVQQASREHQRATRRALDAIAHAVMAAVTDQPLRTIAWQRSPCPFATLVVKLMKVIRYAGGR